MGILLEILLVSFIMPLKIIAPGGIDFFYKFFGVGLCAIDSMNIFFHKRRKKKKKSARRIIKNNFSRQTKCVAFLAW